MLSMSCMYVEKTIRLKLKYKCLHQDYNYIYVHDCMYYVCAKVRTNLALLCSLY